jgi:4-hydroxy-3-methylbut-2-en-1-yl diphosphate reductase
MEINIDRKSSGFCFGVLNAIKKAEEQLQKHGYLFCLGDIVHNNKEVERLHNRGLIVIDHSDLEKIYNTRVLVRAHGEPPSTYDTAQRNNLEIIEATCPVVLQLQNKIKKAHKEMQEKDGQVVIFGKDGHAEVVGLRGQTDDEALVVGNEFRELKNINFSKPLALFSQTTQDKEAYTELKRIIEKEYADREKENQLISFNTICGQVANRGPRLAAFARDHDVVIFVSGKKSSNGRYLFEICREANPQTYFISEKSELKAEWFLGAGKTGICGATSTPLWLMEEIAGEIRNFRM